jgi:hypothetical protein
LLLIRGILAPLRQKFHLSARPNLADHLSLRAMLQALIEGAETPAEMAGHAPGRMRRKQGNRLNEGGRFRRGQKFDS